MEPPPALTVTVVPPSPIPPSPENEGHVPLTVGRNEGALSFTAPLDPLPELSPAEELEPPESREPLPRGLVEPLLEPPSKLPSESALLLKLAPLADPAASRDDAITRTRTAAFLIAQNAPVKSAPPPPGPTLGTTSSPAADGESDGCPAVKKSNAPPTSSTPPAMNPAVAIAPSVIPLE
jgi:hypothetical protein